VASTLLLGDTVIHTTEEPEINDYELNIGFTGEAVLAEIILIRLRQQFPEITNLDLKRLGVKEKSKTPQSIKVTVKTSLR